MNKSSILISGLKVGVSAAMLLVAAGWVSTNPAFEASAATLTADQNASVKTLVQNALANVDPSLTGTTRQQAVNDALARATATAIQTYGTSAISVVANAAVTAGVPAPVVVSAILPTASSAAGVSSAVVEVTIGSIAASASATVVAESIIAVSTQAQYSSSDVGSGLGTAAAEISKTNLSAANEIAAVISNEGTSVLRSKYKAAVIQNGGSQLLADAGEQNPNATAEIPSAGRQGTNGVNSNLPTCANPSCT